MADGCRELVRPRLFRALLPPDAAARAEEYALRRFAADHPGVSWCPAPGCEWAVTAAYGHGGDDEVACGAGHVFCFACKAAAHKPASCGESATWATKDAEEGATATWIVAHTRPCPKCKRAIERSHGCNKVVCSSCGFAFCYLCGGDYFKTHDYPREAWTCNKPPAAENFGVMTDAERRQAELKRYVHFSDRVGASRSSARMMDAARARSDAAIAHLYDVLAAEARGDPHPPLPLALGGPAAGAAGGGPAALFGAAAGGGGGGGGGAFPAYAAAARARAGGGAGAGAGPSGAPASAGGGASPTAGRGGGGAAGGGGAGAGAPSSSMYVGGLADLDFVRAAIDTVVAGRTLAANSYIHGFYITDPAESALFADLQGQLEGTVEKLQMRVQDSALIAVAAGRDPVGVDSGAGAGGGGAAGGAAGAGGGPSSPTAPRAGALDDGGWAAAGGGGGGGGGGGETAWLRSYKKWKVETLTLKAAADTFMRNLVAAVDNGLLEDEMAVAAAAARQAADGPGGGGAGGGGRRAGAGGGVAVGGPAAGSGAAGEAAGPFGGHALLPVARRPVVRET
jgi:hypothetical protein